MFKRVQRRRRPHVNRRRRRNAERRSAQNSRPSKSECRQVPRQPMSFCARSSLPAFYGMRRLTKRPTTAACGTIEHPPPPHALVRAPTKSKQFPPISLTGGAQPKGHPALVASPSQEDRPAGDVPKPPAEAQGQQEQGAVPRRRPRRD